MDHPVDSGNVPFETLRPIIEAIADLVCCHGFNPEEHAALRIELESRGFKLKLIRAAEEWCDRASATCSIIEVLSLFAPSMQGTRIESPLERLFISKRMWKTIEDCRRRGIFSMDMTERLLEGVRAMDTRDWNDSEVRDFIEDACGNPVVVGCIDTRLRKALKGDFGDYYS